MDNKWLACARREYGIAYQLGRSLRDTANPPQGGVARDALTQQLSRSRVSGLREWLSTLEPYLPDGAALGVTAKGVITTMTRLSEDAEKSIFGLEKLDAMAWAVTNIPAELKLDGSGVRALRRAGIPGSSPLGRA